MDRIITSSELSRADDLQLCAFFNQVSETLYRTKPGSPERYAAYVSLENIRREIAHRATRPRPKPPGL
jgi:hypothetical protein